jgi:hypothetical protein
MLRLTKQGWSTIDEGAQRKIADAIVDILDWSLIAHARTDRLSQKN